MGLPHLMFILGGIYLFRQSILHKVSVTILWLFVFVLFACFQLYIGADWKAVVNNISSMAMFPVTIELLRKKDKEELLEISVAFIKFTTWVMAVECLVRYVLATLYPVAEGIYRYKFNSIMFQDTNFGGLILLVVIFFIKYLKIFQDQKQLNIYYFAAVALLLLTISRAAILAYVLGEIIFFQLSVLKFKRQIMFRMLLLFGISIIGGTTIYLWFAEDPSFKSKLYILDVAENVYGDLGLIKYIGAGYNNSEQVLGIYAHNVLFLYFVDTGILGLFLKGIFLLYILIRSQWQGIIVFFPFFIAAQSAVGYGVHYLYVILAVIVLFRILNNKISTAC